MQEFIIKQLHRDNPKSFARKAEAKLLMIMLYYNILIGTITLATFSYFIAMGNANYEANKVYFACQRFGPE